MTVRQKIKSDIGEMKMKCFSKPKHHKREYNVQPNLGNHLIITHVLDKSIRNFRAL